MTVVAAETTQDDSRDTNDYTVGQSFSPSIDCTLDSFEIWVLNNTGSSRGLKLRYGISTNLTTTYIEEIVVTGIADGVNTWVTFTSVGKGTLSTATTYYIAVGRNATETCYCGIATTGSYAGGSYWYDDTPGAWVIDINVSGRDLTFRVNGTAVSTGATQIINILNAGYGRRRIH